MVRHVTFSYDIKRNSDGCVGNMVSCPNPMCRQSYFIRASERNDRVVCKYCKTMYPDELKKLDSRANRVIHHKSPKTLEVSV